jgi:hypothetical protein
MTESPEPERDLRPRYLTELGDRCADPATSRPTNHRGAGLLGSGPDDRDRSPRQQLWPRSLTAGLAGADADGLGHR